MAVLHVPQPRLVEKRPYKFTVINEFLDLGRKIDKQSLEHQDGRCAVRTDDDYLQPDLQPFPGQDGYRKALEALIEKNGGKDRCRLVYITRHAESDHNVKSVQLGKKESFAAADHFDHERDPSLSYLGVGQAKALGARIVNSAAAQFGLPSLVHCSPLWRCVQTAGYGGAQYSTTMNVKIDERWREWKGPGQLHVSDARSSRTTLGARIDTLRRQLRDTEINVTFELDFTELDMAFMEPETIINVDIRLEQALAELFDGGALCRHIVTHGRTSQSLLRLLGFQRDEQKYASERYRVWDFENAGTILLLIKMETREDQIEQERQDNMLQQEELIYINRKYEQDINDGFQSIQQSVVRDPARRQIWLNKLDMLREEEKQNQGVAWRLELLMKALNGTFQHGEFKVRSMP